MKSVSKEEYESFINSYPNPLEADLIMFAEPHVLAYHDFSVGTGWNSIVASKQQIWDDDYLHVGWGNYKILGEG